MSVNLTALAASISAALKQRTGVVVPSSVILAHFNAEGTSAGNNFAGLMQGGKLIQFPTSSAFASEYVNTVAAQIHGGQTKGFIPTGGTLNQQQYAQALQLGGNSAYCGGGCGNFYNVPQPAGVSTASWLTRVVNVLGVPSGGNQNIKSPQGPASTAAERKAATQSSSTMPWWETALILGALLGLVLVVVSKSVGGSPLEIVTNAATGAAKGAAGLAA